MCYDAHMDTTPYSIATTSIASRMGMDILPEPGTVVYDIETDNSEGFGLDPYHSQVTSVSFSDSDSTMVMDQADYSEPALLFAIAQMYALAASRPGEIRLGGWNNYGFDNSFVAVRLVAQRDALSAMGLDIPLTPGEILSPLPHLKAKYSVAGGFEHPQQIKWDGIVFPQFDVSYDYKDYADHMGVKHSLKPVAQSLGAKILEVDRTRLHQYDIETRTAYVAGDTVMTLFLEQQDPATHL